MSARSRSPGGKRGVRVALRVVVPVAFAVLLWYLFTHVARFGTVVSSSMEPTLQIGDYYVLRLDAYDDEAVPQRGDIVVYTGPDGAKYVKRVIAVGNDRVGIAFGRVWLNDRWLKEPYIKERQFPEPPLLGQVPPGHVFVLGDNRNLSEDSRDYGPIPTDRIIGRVNRILWPIGRIRNLGPVEYE